ncbi:type II toxin-antitoxin system prevent-host-death family antitoxin, partial [Streptomyces sp. AC512_CC834]|uniref:type II toxin-antitoxin system prevent-host-death family antitoxin n=1 Tax=Streptomyces sp. AC512_CC834 TaxID=2823691 RepID=UPI001C27791C
MADGPLLRACTPLLPAGLLLDADPAPPVLLLLELPVSPSRSPLAAKTGAATGLLLPPADDPVWGSVPLALRQNLSVPAHRLVSPPRGGLAEKSGRPLRLALSATAKMRTTGAHWHVLLTAPRAAFGGPTSDRAGQAYTLLQQVVDDYLRAASAQLPVAVPVSAEQPSAAQKRAPATPSAPGQAAEPLPATDAPTTPQEQPAPRAADTGPAHSRAALPPSPGAMEPPPAPATPAPAADSDQPAATPPHPALPPGKTKAVPGKTPATLHQARAALPDLIRAAADGTPTPLIREDTDHALLTTPDAATTLGWDLEHAPAHGIADARKKLGDLIHEAAQGHPQVLRRHTTPVAVLLPAT